MFKVVSKEIMRELKKFGTLEFSSAPSRMHLWKSYPHDSAGLPRNQSACRLLNAEYGENKHLTSLQDFVESSDKYWALHSSSYNIVGDAGTQEFGVAIKLQEPLV